MRERVVGVAGRRGDRWIGLAVAVVLTGLFAVSVGSAQADIPGVTVGTVCAPPSGPGVIVTVNRPTSLFVELYDITTTPSTAQSNAISGLNLGPGDTGIMPVSAEHQDKTLLVKITNEPISSQTVVVSCQGSTTSTSASSTTTTSSTTTSTTATTVASPTTTVASPTTSVGSVSTTVVLRVVNAAVCELLESLRAFITVFLGPTFFNVLATGLGCSG